MPSIRLVGHEVGGQDGVKFPDWSGREVSFWDAGFVAGVFDGAVPGVGIPFVRHTGFEARVIVEEFVQFPALRADGVFPASTSVIWLKLPFEQVHDEDDRSAQKLASNAFTHLFNFLGDILEVKTGKLPLPEQGGLLVCPCDKIGVVGCCCSSHGERIRI